MDLPVESDPSKPKAARSYDYMLGGDYNLPVDREIVQRAAVIYPDVYLAARANRAFLRRAVRFLAMQDVEQFLDIGSGLLSVGNLHDVVHQVNADARIVYADIDPEVVLYGRTVLNMDAVPNTTAIRGDVCNPEELLAHPAVLTQLDLNYPVGLLMVAVLHYIVDDAMVRRIITTFSQRLVPGSYIVIAHFTGDGLPDDTVPRLEALARDAGIPVKARSQAELAAILADCTLLPPGLVFAPLWYPEGPFDLFLDEPGRALLLSGVARIG